MAPSGTKLALLIQKIVGHEGAIEFDEDKPDGTPRKLLDTSKLKELGWRPAIKLEEGLASTYAWFVQNLAEARL